MKQVKPLQENSFRDPALVKKVAGRIGEVAATLGRSVRIMEVCGTHTHSIFHFGIRDLLPASVELISGPGCPVCVTPMEFIDQAILLSRQPGVILTTFGDLMRVPGRLGSLLQAKAEGARVEVLYSPLDGVELARKNPAELVIFLGVGFETTAPLSALAIQQAEAEGVRNFAILNAHKLVPPALRILAGGELELDGFLLPGHVSVVIGLEPYRFLAEDFGLPAVVAGFEPLEILDGILRIIEQLHSGRAEVENAYPRVVRPEGNPRAVELIERFFEPAANEWRGLGVLPAAGLAFREEWRRYDLLSRDDLTAVCQMKAGIRQLLARKIIDDSDFREVTVKQAQSNEEYAPNHTEFRHDRINAHNREITRRDTQGAPCICGLVLTGRKTPFDCPSFGTVCNPESPLGACMVSSEGTCAAYHRYQRRGGRTRVR